MNRCNVRIYNTTMAFDKNMFSSAFMLLLFGKTIFGSFINFIDICKVYWIPLVAILKSNGELYIYIYKDIESSQH